jgi:Xaa-Pro aminopeptidase
VTESEYRQRRSAVVAALTERRLDALVVSSPASIRYLTGFTGSNGLLVLSSGSARILTDHRYELQAGTETACKVSVARGSLFTAAAKVLTGQRTMVGFDPRHLSHQAYLELSKASASGLRLLPAAGLVENLRMVKSPGEIDRIRRSCRLASEAFLKLISKLRPGVSEIGFAADIDNRMKRLGAEKPAFETIVAFGDHAAMPHANPGSRLLAENELVLVDMGAFLEGYASDMTRMAFLGRPSRRVRDLHRIVLDAQLGALDAIRDGVTAESVDRAARRVLKTHKLDRFFLHSCGHGLGLEIHEAPRLGRGEKTRLRVGMAVTIEPGVYLQKLGGIRIEDTVMVTPHGCEILTPASKELLTV